MGIVALSPGDCGSTLLTACYLTSIPRRGRASKVSTGTAAPLSNLSKNGQSVQRCSLDGVSSSGPAVFPSGARAGSAAPSDRRSRQCYVATIGPGRLRTDT
jgi:hypothetical protein